MKSRMVARDVVNEFKHNPRLRTDPGRRKTGARYGSSENGIRTCCTRLVLGLLWIPGRSGGKHRWSALIEFWTCMRGFSERDHKIVQDCPNSC